VFFLYKNLMLSNGRRLHEKMNLLYYAMSFVQSAGRTRVRFTVKEGILGKKPKLKLRRERPTENTSAQFDATSKKFQPTNNKTTPKRLIRASFEPEVLQSDNQ